MIYTNQRRRELNKALFSKLQNPLIETFAEEGNPHLFIRQLPEGAEEIISTDCLIRNVPNSPLPWNKVLPVFVPSELDGRKAWMVSYVNCSKGSIGMALEKMEANGMFYVPSLRHCQLLM